MRLKPRKDSNHTEIVAALRQAGCSVFDTAGLGHGFPDLVVGLRGKNYLVEVKDGSLPPSQRKLTGDEVDFHESWRGQIFIVTSVEEAIAFVFGDV